MKKKRKMPCLLLAALLLLALAACGKDSPEPSQTPSQTPKGTEQTKPSAQPAAETTINTPLWDLSYDEADGWVYEEDDFYDDEDFSKIILVIPDEADGSEVINAEIRVSVEGPYNFRDRVSVEGPYNFRDYLTSFGFDEYEYAVNQAYDFTKVGGVDCLEAEGSYWGSPCLG